MFYREPNIAVILVLLKVYCSHFFFIVSKKAAVSFLTRFIVPFIAQ